MSEENVTKLKEKSAVEQMNDLTGKEGKPIEFMSKRGTTFKILPCSLFDLPELHKLIGEWQNVAVDATAGENKFFTADQILKMAKIIKFGIKDNHPNMTEEDIAKSIATSDFPAILNVIMDLNDFFVNMRGITVKTEMANRSANAK